MGKSLLSLEIARQVAAAERARVLFASLEMSGSETAQRHLAAESGVDPERIHLGKIEGDDWPALLSVAQGPMNLPFHLLDDGDLSLFDGGLPAGEVAQATGLARPTVSTTSSRLSMTGDVVKADHGYRLPSKRQAANCG